MSVTSKLSSLQEFVGKEVQIYPGDTHFKYGIIQEISPQGVLFKTTKAHPNSTFEVGKLRFVAFSANLNFQEI